MKDDFKNININVEDFNTMTLIAHKKGFVYAKGHPHEGKMNSALTFKFIIANQRKENSSIDQAINEGDGVYRP